MYDEPTAGLDPVASTVVEDLIRSLHISRAEPHPPSNGAAVAAAADAGSIAAYIVVTHQHSTIRRSVDRLIFLHEVRPQCPCVPVKPFTPASFTSQAQQRISSYPLVLSSWI